MSERILLVDDDPLCLQAWQHSLQSRFDLSVAIGPEEGLAQVRADGNFAVIAADIHMPNMSGIEFLKQVRRLSPESVRLVITADEAPATAADSVNACGVFRLLHKPIHPNELASILKEAMAQYRIQLLESELLDKTLKSCISVLTDILLIIHPAAFGKANQIRALVIQFCDQYPVEKTWELEIAAMMSQLGCVTVPADTLVRAEQGGHLSGDEQAMLADHTRIASQLLEKIPRLERVASLIAVQTKQFAALSGEQDLPLAVESRILRAAIITQSIVAAGGDLNTALQTLRQEADVYGTELLEAIGKVIGTPPRPTRKIPFSDLRSGMVMAKALVSESGTLLLQSGTPVSSLTLMRLQNFALRSKICEPVIVVDDQIPVGG